MKKKAKEEKEKRARQQLAEQQQEEDDFAESVMMRDESVDLFQKCELVPCPRL